MSRRAWAVVFVLAGGVIALNVVLEIADRLTRDPGGPVSSSYATQPRGIAAYADLLRRAGHRVSRVREAPAEAALDPAGTLVMLDPESVTAADVAAVRRFVARGGRLVAGGTSPGAWLDGLLESPPAWSPAGVVGSAPLAPVPETAGVRSVRADGPGSWADPGGALPALGDRGRTLIVVAASGRGRLALLADASPLQNRLLGEADNAALGLALAGPRGRPVRFLEGVHGYLPASGIAAVPDDWWVVLGGLALAALAYMLARGRRLGPPELEGRELAPARREYVESLAAVLARTKRPGEAAEPVRQAVRNRIARSAGLGREPDGGELYEAGRRLGLPHEELAAVLGRDGDPIAAGRALARVTGTAR